MTDYQMKLFLTAAQTRNFTTAAAQLYLSQPAMSRQIAALENELGVPLFLRQNNMLELTQAGQLFYEKLQPIQQELSAAVREVRDLGAGVTGRLRIGLMEDQQLLQSLGQAVHDLLVQYPGLEVDIRRFGWQEMLERLDRQELDLFQAPVYDGLPPERYRTLRLTRERMYLAYNPRYCSLPDPVLQSGLEAEGLPDGWPVYVVATSVYPEIIRSHMPLIRLRGTHYVEAVSSIPLYVLSGMGASIVNEKNMMALYPDVALLPLDFEPVTQGLIWRADAENPVLQRLLDRLPAL